ncbi:cell envelope integrity protein CreD [bacterium]|nr:MAG: cell envelope integrity protein CreD [bacterium]
MTTLYERTARSTQTLKLVGIGAMSLSLLIPLTFVRGLVYERQANRDAAVAEITDTWGGAQSVVGPVVVVPYRYEVHTQRDVEVDGRIVRRAVTEPAVDFAYFLPAALKVAGRVSPSKLHRGIYDAVVYSGKVTLSGRLAQPDWKALKVDEKDVLWDDAVLTVAISDLRGAKGALVAELGGRRYAMLPGSRLPGYPSGVHATVGRQAAGEQPFELTLDLNGSGSVRFAPLGMRNLVSLSSPWPDPKFSGAFLPSERRVSKDGFSAEWDVSYYGRSYPQQSTGRGGGQPEAEKVDGSLFGVSFLNPVDAYRNAERATKYGLLFVAMAFSAFFLFEVRSQVAIHPVQYVLVGAALVLFFLVLLSLSEFLAFGPAYAGAAAAATLMVGLYSLKFLGGGRRAAGLGAGLGGVYGFLYVVLQLQDYSLLMGSALLTATLGGLMYFTRDVDWYALDMPQPPSPLMR